MSYSSAALVAAGPAVKYLHAGDHWVALLPKATAFIDGSGVVKTRKMKGDYGANAVLSRDGKRLFIRSHVVVILKLPENRGTEITWPPEIGELVGFSGPDRVVSRNGRKLVLAAVGDKQLTTVATLDSDVTSAFLIAGGGAALVTCVPLDEPGFRSYTLLVRVKPDGFEVLARVTSVYITDLREVDGHVLVREPGDRIVEILGIPALLG